MNVQLNEPGMNLSSLLAGYASVPPLLDRDVRDLSLDSRTLRPGACFIALAGRHENGIRFAADAERRGAVAILAEAGHPVRDTGLPCIEVPALREKLADLASRFFDNPGKSLRLFAVTGTKGKTTVAYLTAQALGLLSRPCGYIGTLGAGVPGNLEPTQLTTPDIVTINRLLAGFRASGMTDACVEASSHALDQGRLDGLDLHAAAFTNLGHDHLDYHGDRAAYGAAKRRLFERRQLTCGIVNIDDAFGAELAASLNERLPVIACSSKASEHARIRAGHIRPGIGGTAFELTIDDYRAAVESTLVGRFAVDNLLLLAGFLTAAGYAPASVAACLESVTEVPGRMQRCTHAGSDIEVFVDYAHTPESLEAALNTLAPLSIGDLHVVFGCGGERDTSKRGPMGQAAARFADRITVTSDNPRSEDPSAICADIVAGIGATANPRVMIDRGEAIRGAIQSAAPGDTVLIAGKGHENVQVLAHETRAFDDRLVVAQALTERQA